MRQPKTTMEANVMDIVFITWRVSHSIDAWTDLNQVDGRAFKGALCETCGFLVAISETALTVANTIDAAKDSASGMLAIPMTQIDTVRVLASYNVDSDDNARPNSIPDPRTFAEYPIGALDAPFDRRPTE